MKFKWVILPIIILIFLFLTSIAAPSKEAETTSMEDTADQTEKNGTDVAEHLLQPDLVIKASPDIYYGISRQDGLLFSADAGNNWEQRNDGLPKKLVYPFLKEKVRTLTDLGVDPVNPARIAVITAQTIHISEDYGKTWSLIQRHRPIPVGAYLTAVALSPIDKNTILLGTSFAGIFETKDRGKTWSNITQDLKFLYQGSDYWEEIAAVAYQRDNPECILFKCGFGQGIYQLNKDRKIAERINFLEFNSNSVLHQLQSLATPKVNIANNLDALGLHGNPAITQSGLDIVSQLNKEGNYKTEGPEEDPAKLGRLHTAANKYGIYIRADKARGMSLDEKINFIKKNNLNTMVIDFKDDFGFLTYDTKLTWPKQVGAVRKNAINIEELLRKAKQNGIYVIGRLVVFQDPQLFCYQNHKYAVWDQTANKPWNTKEYWVDPFAKDVWEYNREIAEELQTLGVDEIQFDYIRFPTDGNISRITFRYRPEGAEKTDAVESFLAYVREKITVPISTDLYGFSCWCRSLSSNGQNLDSIADYVDVICPMYYPSHFPNDFLPDIDYLERAHKIYFDGTSRAISIVEGRAIVRPYVQAFRLGKELKMTVPVYSQYLINQIEGNMATTSPGFTLWDYSNSYYMVPPSFAAILKKDSQNITK